MELNDYTTPDAYAPRPRAAQAVAAQRRQQRHDDAPPAPSAAPTPRQYLPFGIGALVLIVLMIAAATWQLSHGISRPLQLTPVATVSAFAPVSPPAPSPQPPAPALDAYAAPDGAILGPIELDRQIVAVAHYGSGWVQANVTGSGLVWLRAADFPALAIIGPDLAPAAQPAPQAAPVQAAQEPPPPPPAPVRCAQAGIPGQMAEVCGTDDLSALQTQAKAAWLAQYGGNPGVLDSPTPQPMDAGSERR